MRRENLALFAEQDISLSPAINEAVRCLAEGTQEERGAIYTRREVVDFILDLVGYTAETKLHQQRILEPSFGAGDFLVPIVERLIAAFKRYAKKSSRTLEALATALRAVELHRGAYQITRNKLIAFLSEEGFSHDEITMLVDAWLINGDFLLSPLADGFSFVVGNPPYVRQELIPDPLLREYRRRFLTIYDRADLYIPFIEKSLLHLNDGGALGFICADRWMKNRYGGPLRKLVSDDFRLKFFVDMVDTPAFHSEVSAYPAITVITHEPKGTTRIAYRPEINAQALGELAKQMHSSETESPLVRELGCLTSGDSPWILDLSEQIRIVKRLEADFPTLEEAGCKVGIGVATGADKVFIAPYAELDVEEDRKVPLATTRDILDGSVKWRGLGVINPFSETGSLVRLADYPKLEAYLEKHGTTIRARHVSKKNPEAWYRTIDRITPSLTTTPKLLIPDIKGEAHIVYEDGKLYPHHNLYYITSDSWDLKALRAVLLSGIARLFIATYSTRMRGGYLRFQAQYLRRIRLPRWHDVPHELQVALVEAAERGDVAACDAVTFKVFRLTEAEQAALGETKD
jgi:TaqI-like C-terminal specificity domain/Eco57I restriction-modification methylase